MSGEGTLRLRLAGVVPESVTDGPGFRMTVFVQGCPHRCPGCHNPQTHDPDGGYEADVDLLFDAFCRNPLLAGVTFSGGEPFEQAAPLAVLAEKVKAAGKTVWIYSGYTLEELLRKSRVDEGAARLLKAGDVLVDGPFVAAERSLALPFRGSANQRILDLPRSLESGAAREYNEYENSTKR